MAETTDEEHLDNPTNTQSENPSNQITFNTSKDTFNPNHETENMEVHHHPHVGKKNFKEYLLEGLMIFLAVTMGFFAESLREHLVNKEHEKQYMSSFIEDLSKDENRLPILIRAIEDQQLRPADSLFDLLPKMSVQAPANNIYQYLRIVVRQQDVHLFVTDRTIQQIKNSGEMRLISDKQISNSIIEYYKQIDFIAYLQQFLVQAKLDMYKTSLPLMSAADFDKVADNGDNIINPKETLHLRSINKEIINDFLLKVSIVKSLSKGVRLMIINAKKQEIDIKNLISTKFKIKD
jgi:hypothetical protein